jgi:3-isopropylmalate dehydrogenase
VHGSAPDIAGRGVANPLGAIASAAMLLRHTACLEQEAQDIEEAIRAVLEAGHRTLDLDRGGSHPVVTTSEMGSLISDALAEIADRRFAYHAV